MRERAAGHPRAGDTFGPYELMHQIAAGGMAEIYLARARGISGFEKYVALKMILPDRAADHHFIEMLVEEAKISVNLNHSNIVQIFDLGRIGDVYYIAMEVVDGLDLFQIMRTVSRAGIFVEIDVAVYIAAAVCAGLDYAHNSTDQQGRPLNLIHRDISPQNVLISRSGEVKIADFGIAKATLRSRETGAGIIKGKYYYMSPEQAYGEPLDPRSDIFSAGVVLWEVLAGRMLHLEEDVNRLLENVRQADVPSPRTLRTDVPVELDALVMQAVERHPADRYPNAAQFQTALTQFLYRYRPDFSVQRVRDLVALAVDLEDAAKASERSVITALQTLEAEPDHLMSADDYGSLSAHSIILGDYLDYGEGDDDTTTLPADPRGRGGDLAADAVAGSYSADDTRSLSARAPSADDPYGRGSVILGDGDDGVTERGFRTAETDVWSETEGTTVPRGQRVGGGQQPRGRPPRGDGRVWEPTAPVSRQEMGDLREGPSKRALAITAAVIGGFVLIAAIVISLSSAANRPGVIELRSRPPGAKVIYRGGTVGKTPVTLRNLNADEKHEVQLEIPGCPPQAFVLRVEAGEKKTISLELRKCD